MEKFKIELRTLITALSILAILSFTVGGYLYYSSLREYSEARAHNEAVEKLRDLGNNIDTFLNWSLLSVKSMAGLKELKQSLSDIGVADLHDTNLVLEQFRDNLKVSVCYLMDIDGNTIASSNYRDPNSFVGKNYGFRSYFKQAIRGEESVYMALGITSMERGVYYSSPVFSKEEQKPIGVAVIKAPVEIIERDFMKSFDGAVVLIDPNGVIFLSNRSDWLYHLLWQISSDSVLSIEKEGQFGNGPWKWTGMKFINQDLAVDSLGKEYRVHKQGLANYPDWTLVYLHSNVEVMENVINPLRKTVGVVAIVLCVFFGFIVLFLFLKANTEITQRKIAEMEQKHSFSKLKATLESTADGILVVDRNGRVTAFNKQFVKMWEIPEAVLELQNNDTPLLEYISNRLKNPDDFVKKVKELYADMSSESFDTLYFKNGRIFERYSRPQNLDEEIIGRVWSFRDVTERVMAQKEREEMIVKLQNTLEEIKTLRGILPICSSCKKIRDDKGYWNQIESYISNHSSAEFSHSLCPECSDKLYGDQDWYIELKKEE
jgi:C4-dicarboxylate-specific signal transduction histidine kinase